jgi:hypothetical protein
MDTKVLHKEIVDQAIFDGIQIEKNIESEISKVPPEFQRIDYLF